MAIDRKVFGGIGKKLLIWFLIISIIPTAGVTFVSYQHSKKLVEEELAGLLDSTVDMVSKEIRNFIMAKKAKLIDFSADGLIRDGLMVISSGEPDNEAIIERLNHHLSMNKLPLDHDIIEAFVIDENGKVVVSSNERWLGMDASHKDYFIEGWRYGIYVSDMHFFASEKEPTITMSRVVTNLRTSNPIGMMVIIVRGNTLSSVTKSWAAPGDKNTPRFRGMGRTGEVYVVNEDHLMITESRFIEKAPFGQIVHTEPVKRAFTRGEETAGVYLDYRGVKVLGAARLIEELRWLVLAEKDFAEVVKPINGLRNIGIGLSIVDALIVTIIAFFTTRTLTKPIHNLVEATEKVAKGDLDYRVLTTSKDEIGHLSNSFNEMIHDLKKSRGELRALFDDSIDAMFVLGGGEVIADVNKSACALLGRERNALIGHSVSELVSNEETMGKRKMIMDAARKTWALQAGEKHPTLDVALAGKGGEEVLCELDLKRTDYGIYAVFRDVTTKKRLEQTITEEKQRLDDIVSELGAGLSLVDNDMKVVWMNKTQAEWFGSLERLRGKECYNAYWQNEEVCQGCPSKRTFITGNIEKVLHVHTTPDGKQKWYNVTSSPIKNRAGQVTHVLELVEDVTEEKKAEEEFRRMHQSVVQANIKLEQTIKDLRLTQQQLIQAEKMASVGQLAASVAHEINNPLSYIDNNLNILGRYSERIGKFLKKCEEGKPIFEKGELPQILSFFKEADELKKEIKLDFILEDFVEIVKESRNGTEQIKRIVSNLSTFSHAGEDLPRYASINKVIESIIAMVWSELKYKAEVIKEYGDIPDIKCYPQQLGQVFMNLLTNAAHSIADKGKIWIKTYKVEKSICVEVKDNGKGMSEEVQTKIFEPFFTTKEPGKGTGLGLTVAYNIIQKHFGKIEVSSKVGQGSTFTVVIPIRE